jgi:hypothetical protein
VNLTQLTHPALATHDPRLVRWELFVFSDVRFAQIARRDVLHATPLDATRRPLPDRVAVEQQRDHHRRIVRRPTMPVNAIGHTERRQIHRRNSVHGRRLRTAPLCEQEARVQLEMRRLRLVRGECVRVDRGHAPIRMKASASPRSCEAARLGRICRCTDPRPLSSIAFRADEPGKEFRRSLRVTEVRDVPCSG